MRSKFDIPGAVTIGSTALVLMAALAGCGSSVSADATATAATPAASDPAAAASAEDAAATTRPDSASPPTGDARFERFIQALQSCRPSTYDQQHPLVADFTVVHTVHGKDRDRCKYSQTMPGGMRMVCMLDAEGVAALIEAQRKWLAGGPIQASSSAGFEQQCQFDGVPSAALQHGPDPGAASQSAASDPAFELEAMNEALHSGDVLYVDSSETSDSVISETIGVGPGTKVIDKATGKVLIDGTQTEYVEVELKKGD